MTGTAGGAPLVSAFPTTEVIERLGEPARLLTAAELGRAARLRSARDRSDFLAAHGLVRLVAARLLGCAPGDITVVQRCDRCGGEHGRPSVAEAPALCVSLSHTRGFVAAIAGFVPVAVDVDHPPAATDDALVRLALGPAERAFVAGAADPGLAFARHWVRKESLVKLGVCTLDTLAGTELTGLPVETSWSSVSWSSAGAGAWVPAPRRLRWRQWHLLEWSDPATRTVGTAIAGAPPALAVDPSATWRRSDTPTWPTD